MIAKGTADLLCNVRHIIAIARPHYGFASDPSLLENVCLPLPRPPSALTPPPPPAGQGRVQEPIPLHRREPSLAHSLQSGPHGAACCGEGGA
jgi:hypothetical protein